eukprot:4500886-Prymnesium_polylepis.1
MSQQSCCSTVGALDTQHGRDIGTGSVYLPCPWGARERAEAHLKTIGRKWARRGVAATLARGHNGL